MQIEKIKLLIEQGLSGADVQVDGDGAHFYATVITQDFAGKTRIQRQQLVYSTVQAYILDGSLHALSIKTYTPAEWQQKD